MQERVEAEKAPKQAASDDSDASELTQHSAGSRPVRVQLQQQLQEGGEGLQVKLQVPTLHLLMTQACGRHSMTRLCYAGGPAHNGC